MGVGAMMHIAIFIFLAGIHVSRRFSFAAVQPRVLLRFLPGRVQPCPLPRRPGGQPLKRLPGHR